MKMILHRLYIPVTVSWFFGGRNHGKNIVYRERELYKEKRKQITLDIKRRKW